MKTKAIIFGSLAGVIALWTGWLLLIQRYTISKLPIALDRSPSIGEFGAFGDSFGAFSALMAASAAAAAFIAYFRQQRDTSIQEFERNFLVLLNNLQLIVSQVDLLRHEPDEMESLRAALAADDINRLEFRVRRSLTPYRTHLNGRDAIRTMLAILRSQIDDQEKFKDSKQIAREFESFYNRWHDDLGHYFRTCYHIFRMIDENCPQDPQRYARMARAHLSSSETILLAYNCSVGRGRFKFKGLAEKYSLFHNYHLDPSLDFFRHERDFFLRMMDNNAFRIDEDGPFEYT